MSESPSGFKTRSVRSLSYLKHVSEPPPISHGTARRDEQAVTHANRPNLKREDLPFCVASCFAASRRRLDRGAYVLPACGRIL